MFKPLHNTMNCWWYAYPYIPDKMGNHQCHHWSSMQGHSWVVSNAYPSKEPLKLLEEVLKSWFETILPSVSEQRSALLSLKEIETFHSHIFSLTYEMRAAAFVTSSHHGQQNAAKIQPLHHKTEHLPPSNNEMQKKK